MRKQLEVRPPALLRVMEPLGLLPPGAASATPTPAAETESPLGQAEVFYKRGMARMKVGEVAAAIADYDRALQLRPDYAEALANRAAARQSVGDSSGAV